MEMIDLPPDWEEALARAAAAERVAVVGPTDVGKSTFLHALAARRAGLRLLDLDPGQKMLGAAGTASLGRIEPELRLEHFVWLGSTAVGSFRALAEAAVVLAERAQGPLAVNTSGYVAGPGARLQAMTLSAVQPDLVVAIAAEHLVGNLSSAIRLERSAHARRKSPARRAAIRQAAFAAALEGAFAWPLPEEVLFEPGPPLPFEGPERPVCALADAAGEDMEVGVLFGSAVLVRRPPRPVARVRLGKMWAAPADGGWKLLERLAPAWMAG